MYFAGVVLSQIGVNGTFAVMLYHVYVLSGSTLQVGLVGAARGIAVLVLSPLGGYYADKLDRKRFLQSIQIFSMMVSGLLALASSVGFVEVWHIWVAALLNSAAATFDSPVRKAIIPALVPRDELVQAFALINPGNQVGKLLGPGLGGLLIAVAGPGFMYFIDAATYLGLVVILMAIRIPAMQGSDRELKFWSSTIEGVQYVRKRPVILHLMGLDLSATLFAAYRVVLPAIAVDILMVGPTGYGVLAAATPVGALIGGVIVYRLASMNVPAGHLVIGATMAYGMSAILLAQSSWFSLAMVAAAGIGLFDAIATTIRHAAVLNETPDQLRGRVSAIYGMASRGGPPLGEFNVGWLAGVVGASLALTFGGFVPIVYALGVLASSTAVRSYRMVAPAVESP